MSILDNMASKEDTEADLEIAEKLIKGLVESNLGGWDWIKDLGNKKLENMFRLMIKKMQMDAKTLKSVGEQPTTLNEAGKELLSELKGDYL